MKYKDFYVDDRLEEIKLILESPLLVNKYDVSELVCNSENYRFTQAVTSKVESKETYKQFDVYSYTIKNITCDLYVYSDLTYAFFMYEIKGDDIYGRKVWQEHTHRGLCRDILKNVYLKKYNVVSDDVFSEMGKHYYKKLIKSLLSDGHKVICFNQKTNKFIQDITGEEQLEKYFGNDSNEFLDFRFKIFKK